MSEPYDVELRQVTKAYGSVKAVRGVNLAVRRGEFLSILGPTGCGKTSTLRLIAGLEEPDEGEIFLGGQDATNLDPTQRPTNTVFQQYALFPHLTAAENVAYGLQVRRVPKSEIQRSVAEMFGLVRLKGKENSRPSQLSGGEQQRVALARALVNHPRILLLDEPLSSIDQALRSDMQEQLHGLQRELGITFVLVTHDQQEALTMSDRVAIMREGRVEQVGDGRGIYDRPATVFVARFLGEVNLLPGQVAAIERGVVSVDTPSGRLVALQNGTTCRVGQDITIGIRPERIVLGPQAAKLPNHLDGVVVREIFRGPTRAIIARTDDGQTLKAVDLSHLGEAAAPGTRITLGWLPEHAIPLVE
jgi:spermidine/putrescine transport system ATP-binding protein